MQVSGKKKPNIPYNTSFASHKKAKFWHPIRNGGLLPEDVCKGSNKKYWFKCHECSHDFEININYITGRGSWCQYCCKPSKKICNDSNCKHCFEKSFASHEKAKFWHPTKNGEIEPRNISIRTNKKYWFKCDVCHHDFDINISSISNGSWCRYCVNSICDDLNCKHCFNRSFAISEKSKYWHPTKNGKIKPRDVMKSVSNKYWFKCHTCDHDLELLLSNVSKGQWCAYCCKPCQKLCGNKKCNHCFKNSFASHDKAKYWNTTKNNDIHPWNVVLNSERKYWFDCSKCCHSFEMGLDKITSGCWCPYCCKPCKNLCESDNCKHCFKNSFASHEKSKFWHPNKNIGLKPRDIHLNSTNISWFKCPDCNHDFDKVTYSIMNGHWCPFCSNQRLCENNNCNLCYNKSFASHEKSKYWNYIKNINKKDEKIKPRNVFKSSTSKKYWFKCNICNEDFNIKLGSIVSQNSWCPICVNKTEKKLHHWITERKNEFNYIHYQTQYKPEWAVLRKTHNTRYIYDFYLEFYDVKIIIELDGRQHYKQVSNWSTPLHNQIRDKIKENLATNQDINIIRLNQEDVFNDKGNWEKELLQSIHSIRENSDKITMIYDLTDSKRYIVK